MSMHGMCVKEMDVIYNSSGTSGNGDGHKLLSSVWVSKQTCKNHKKNGRERPGNEEENR